jgi:hypothetical protein
MTRHLADQAHGAPLPGGVAARLTGLAASAGGTWAARPEDAQGTTRGDTAGPVAGPVVAGGGGRANAMPAPDRRAGRRAGPGVEAPVALETDAQGPARPSALRDAVPLLSPDAMAAGFEAEQFGDHLRLSHACGKVIRVHQPTDAELRWRVRTHRCGPADTEWHVPGNSPAPRRTVLSRPAHLPRERRRTTSTRGGSRSAR